MRMVLATVNAPAIKTKFFMINSPSNVNKNRLLSFVMISFNVISKENVDTRCTIIIAITARSKTFNASAMPIPISIHPNTNTNNSVEIPGNIFSTKGMTGDSPMTFSSPNQRNTNDKDIRRMLNPCLFTNLIA